MLSIVVPGSGSMRKPPSGSAGPHRNLGWRRIENAIAVALIAHRNRSTAVVAVEGDVVGDQESHGRSRLGFQPPGQFMAVSRARLVISIQPLA